MSSNPSTAKNKTKQKKTKRNRRIFWENLTNYKVHCKHKNILQTRKYNTNTILPTTFQKTNPKGLQGLVTRERYKERLRWCQVSTLTAVLCQNNHIPYSIQISI